MDTVPFRRQHRTFNIRILGVIIFYASLLLAAWRWEAPEQPAQTNRPPIRMQIVNGKEHIQYSREANYSPPLFRFASKREAATLLNGIAPGHSFCVSAMIAATVYLLSLASTRRCPQKDAAAHTQSSLTAEALPGQTAAGVNSCKFGSLLSRASQPLSHFFNALAADPYVHQKLPRDRVLSQLGKPFKSASGQERQAKHVKRASLQSMKRRLSDVSHASTEFDHLPLEVAKAMDVPEDALSTFDSTASDALSDDTIDPPAGDLCKDQDVDNSVDLDESSRSESVLDHEVGLAENMADDTEDQKELVDTCVPASESEPKEELEQIIDPETTFSAFLAFGKSFLSPDFLREMQDTEAEVVSRLPTPVPSETTKTSESAPPGFESPCVAALDQADISIEDGYLHPDVALEYRRSAARSPIKAQQPQSPAFQKHPAPSAVASTPQDPAAIDKRNWRASDQAPSLALPRTWAAFYNLNAHRKTPHHLFPHPATLNTQQQRASRGHDHQQPR